MRSLILTHPEYLVLRQITPEELDEWVHALFEIENKAPATVRKTFHIASSVLDYAVVLRKLPANPALVGIVLPAVEEREMPFLEVC